MKLEPFSETIYAFQADTDSTHAYSNPTLGEDEIAERVVAYKRNDKVTEIRVATYKLEYVRTVYKK